jgi:hypothetical protein
MVKPYSDAFVICGVTGDLAHETIFPQSAHSALQTAVGINQAAQLRRD